VNPKTLDLQALCRFCNRLKNFFREDCGMPRKKITEPEIMDQTTGTEMAGLTE